MENDAGLFGQARSENDSLEVPIIETLKRTLPEMPKHFGNRRAAAQGNALDDGACAHEGAF